jgi:hypothetical protein
MAVHLSSTHKGNIYEILSDFLLSFLGVANPPRRQFDDGYDFYCSISTEANGLLTFGSPFMIQIKSGSSLKVQYGKHLKKWKQEDIHWLFRHEIPFFIGFIDIHTKSLSIYDTTGLWYLYCDGNINCSQVVFKPNEHPQGTRRKIPKVNTIKNWEANKGDGNRYEIDLGNPIIDISVNDIDNSELLQQKKDILRSIILIERENIINRNLGINFFKEIKQNSTNELFGIETGTKILQYYDQKYISRIYDSIKFAMVSLALNLDSNGRQEESNAVKNLIRFIPHEGLYKDLYDQNPELSAWLNKPE